MESNQPFGLFRPALIRLSYPTVERAVRLELTNTGFAIRRLSRLATRANWNGRRDSNSRVEFGRLACFQLHHFRMVGEDRIELSPRVPRTRMLTLHHTPIQIGGTERTRTVIGLIDNQVPNPSATVPCEKIWVGRRDLNPHLPHSQCGALLVEATTHIDRRQVNDRDATFTRCSRAQPSPEVWQG